VNAAYNIHVRTRAGPARTAVVQGTRTQPPSTFSIQILPLLTSHYVTVALPTHFPPTVFATSASFSAASHALHRCSLLLQMSHVAWSVCLFVGHSPYVLRKTGEPIEIPFWGRKGGGLFAWIQGTTYYMGVEIPTGRDNFGGCPANWTALGVQNPMTSSQLTTTQPPYLNNLISTQRPRTTRSSSVVTLARPPTSSSLKITDRSFLLFVMLCLVSGMESTPFNSPLTSFCWYRFLYLRLNYSFTHHFSLLIHHSLHP